jgi:hypothetical protein
LVLKVTVIVLIIHPVKNYKQNQVENTQKIFKNLDDCLKNLVCY